MMNGDAAVACFRTAATSPASAGGSRTSTTGKRIVRRGPCLPRRRAIRAVEHVGRALRPACVLPQHEGLRIREPRERARSDLEHAVRRILVQVGGVERDDGGDPGAFHVGAERRAHERQRLVGAPLEQQVRAAPPLARGHVAEPHQRHGCREHRDDERHDDREADGAVGHAPPAERQTPADPRERARRRPPGARLSRRPSGLSAVAQRRRIRSRSSQDLALAVVAGRAGVQRDRRGGRLLGIDERGFPVVARQRRQLLEELARQLVDEILGEIAAADEQPLRAERLDRLGSAPGAGWPRP